MFVTLILIGNLIVLKFETLIPLRYIKYGFNILTGQTCFYLKVKPNTTNIPNSGIRATLTTCKSDPVSLTGHRSQTLNCLKFWVSDPDLDLSNYLGKINYLVKVIIDQKYYPI